MRQAVVSKTSSLYLVLNPDTSHTMWLSEELGKPLPPNDQAAKYLKHSITHIHAARKLGKACLGSMLNKAA